MDPFPRDGAPLESGQTSVHSTRQRQALPVKIAVPSFSAFRAQTPSISVGSPVRRKPLPPNASPLLTRPSSGVPLAAIRNPGHDPSLIQDSLQRSTAGPNRALWSSQPWSSSPPLVVRDLDRYPHGQSPFTPQVPENESIPAVAAGQQSSALQPGRITISPPTRLSHVRLASDSLIPSNAHRPLDQNKTGLQRSATMSLHPARSTPLRLDVNPRTFSNQSNDSYDSASTSKPLKSPSNRLTTFFGWKTSSPGADSSATTFSDKSHSPIPSPLSPSPQSSSSSRKSVPFAVDIPKVVATPKASYFADSGLLPTRPEPAMSTQVGEMEEELREVSSELAASIKREMDLEDLVDRLQLEASQGPDANRRTSDYFSDSGTSSVRYPLSEMGGKSEDLEKLKRTLEQDKAQFKVDFSQKLQIERARRKVLETHIHRLEERAQQVKISLNHPTRTHLG
ncbi:MAG: hypothetical protein M1830_006523 [Pleopsidium flavum]|nr:MAG: hypothetical protein M1830_006523 [Pleopsidium flavum]